MTVTENTPPHDTGADIRRLLDAGYQVTFQLWELSGPREYFANVTSEFGSRWRSFGATPGEALRACWPLGYGPGQGGCGHCGGMGCEKAGCVTCAAYTDKPGNGVCGVCGAGCDDDGQGDDDDLQPYCTQCDVAIGIFHGYGPGWHHWRDRGDGGAELVAAGHAPAVAWRAAGGQYRRR
jgi:hypothetical protein